MTPLIEEAQCHGSVVLEVETGDLRLTAFEGCEEWEVLCWTKDGIPPGHIRLLDREGREVKEWPKHLPNSEGKF